MTQDFRKSIGVICDKETATGFYIGGLPLTNPKGEENFLMIDEDTTDLMINEFYEQIHSRKDISLIFVGFDIRNRIKNLRLNTNLPFALIIPTKNTLENNIKEYVYLDALYKNLEI